MQVAERGRRSQAFELDDRSGNNINAAPTNIPKNNPGINPISKDSNVAAPAQVLISRAASARDKLDEFFSCICFLKLGRESESPPAFALPVAFHKIASDPEATASISGCAFICYHQVMADDAKDILFGQSGRHRDKLWGKDQGTIFARYLLPQMRGIMHLGSSAEEKQWIERHYHQLRRLWEHSLENDYRLNDTDRRLLQELINWYRRPGSYPINHFSDLDPYNSTDDLLLELECMLI